MNKQQLEKRRLWLAGGGLALVGAGLTVAMDAGNRRARSEGLARWVSQGTLGLTLVGAGLSVFGEAVALRGLLLARHAAEDEASRHGQGA